jgi:hypothetical protein
MSESQSELQVDGQKNFFVALSEEVGGAVNSFFDVDHLGKFRAKLKQLAADQHIALQKGAQVKIEIPLGLFRLKAEGQARLVGKRLIASGNVGGDVDFPFVEISSFQEEDIDGAKSPIKEEEKPNLAMVALEGQQSEPVAQQVA